DRDDATIFLGIGVGVTISTALLLTLIFGKSFRRWFKTICKTMIPQGLCEDFPNLENSNVIKSLQDKNELPHMNSIQISYSNDPPVTEVKETLIKDHDSCYHEDHVKLISNNLENSAQVLKLMYEEDDLCEQNNGYKPQISTRSQRKGITDDADKSNLQEAAKPNPEPKQSLENLISTMPWKKTLEGVISLPEGMDIDAIICESQQGDILNNSREMELIVYSNYKLNEKSLLFGRLTEEQTLLPDEMLMCLRHLHNDSPHVNHLDSYFPQIVVSSLKKKISHFQE
uniref:Uncharacterized protein n=1 Tax=Latimeria chalumnae TaxID=7897 RepID=H3AJ86_LATCH